MRQNTEEDRTAGSSLYSGSGNMHFKGFLLPAVAAILTACGHIDDVDLSLKPFQVEWAACNLGATVPEEPGTYFAWGETHGKDFYSLDNYHGSGAPLVLDPEQDAAALLLGNGWRMPTKADWDELRYKGLWKMIVRNGVAGYRVTSRIDGEEVVFLPAGGFYRDGVLLFGKAELLSLEDGTMSWKGAECHFWTSEIRTDYTSHAWYYGLSDQGYGQLYDASRSLGMNIRPVRDK